MENRIFISKYTLESFDQIINYISKNNGRILFHDNDLNQIIAESQFFEDHSFSDSLTVENPHKDLLPAFFNLTPDKPFDKKLFIKSSSLTSLIQFYQNLISNLNFSSIEITHSKHNKQYYGLLAGENKDFETPDGIELTWLSPHQSLDALYNI